MFSISVTKLSSLFCILETQEDEVCDVVLQQVGGIPILLATCKFHKPWERPGDSSRLINVRKVLGSILDAKILRFVN